MPELQMDVAVANRFISSLSKSLQALCHGCMDFDSGIEIVGYINVNIDSGSKVDYVLNEKVLKSTTNSMTFVSNSFLAKKEPQKQSRDGACSPIPHLSASSSYSSGSHPSSQYHRTASQVPSHSQIAGGSQKRSWTDDWRISPKRHRMQHPHMAVQPFPDQNSQSHPQSFPSSSHNYSDTSFKQPQGAASMSTASNLQLQINIKKEALETDNQNAADSEVDQPADDQAQDSSQNGTNKIKIKCDPDADQSDTGETSFADGNSAAANEKTDFKGTFLDPSSSDMLPSDDGTRQQESDVALPAFDDNSETDCTEEQGLTDDAHAASVSTANIGDGDAGMSGDNEMASDAAVEYDQAGEEGSYSQSAYEDAGEGGSDAGQLEVIEIDDEDEDVQAMFGDTHSAHSSFSQPLDTSRSHHHNVSLNTSYPSATTRHMRNRQEQKETYFVFDQNSQMYSCPACGKEYRSSSGARFHYKIKHCGAFDHYCQACGKGFQQKSHLKAHMSLHMQQKNFKCNVCGSQYAHKTSLTAHQKLVHGN